MFFPYYYGFASYGDSLYTLAIVLLVIGLVISIAAQIKVNSTFKKYSGEPAPFSGAEAARRLLESQGVYNVKIERVNGNLTDHFDPKTNTIRLSEAVYDARTIAAVGVACHEAGHAVQYAKSYGPIKLRNKIIPITRFGSTLAMPMVLLGLVFSFYPLSLIGVAFFGLSVMFQLITLPVEFNASARAISAIKENLILRDDEAVNGTKKVLSAAAMTYVAALLISFAQFLRLLALVNRRRR